MLIKVDYNMIFLFMIIIIKTNKLDGGKEMNHNVGVQELHTRGLIFKLK